MASLYVFLCFEKLLIWENMPINIQQSIFEVDQKMSSKLSKNKNAFSFLDNFDERFWSTLKVDCVCVCVCGVRGGGGIGLYTPVNIWSESKYISYYKPYFSLWLCYRPGYFN